MTSTPEGPYSFEHRFEATSGGKGEVWVVVDATSSVGRPLATCYSENDALLVTRSLNLGMAQTRLSVHD